MTRLALLAPLALLLASCAAPCDPYDYRRTTFADPADRLPGCDIDVFGRYVEPKEKL